MIDVKALLLSALLPAMALLHGNWDPPKTTISEAMVRAQSEQRQLMLYFTSAMCKTCSDTDSYFSREDVHKALEANFVTATVNIEDFDGRACSEVYGIEGVPAIVIVEPDGEVKFKRNGDLTTGDLETIITTGSIPSSNSTQKAPPRETTSYTQPQSVSKPEAGAFSIQVGFFSSEANAEKLATTIEGKGFDRPVIVEETRDGKIFYRVLVGQYADSEGAKRDMEELRGSGYSVKVHTTE